MQRDSLGTRQKVVKKMAGGIYAKRCTDVMLRQVDGRFEQGKKYLTCAERPWA